MLILVGEAFGEDEEAEGVPFVGRAGGVLDYILHNIGLPRDRLYITNLINERPYGPQGPNDISEYFSRGSLTAKGLEARNALLAELYNVQCPIVVPLGNTALAALTEGIDIGGEEDWQEGDEAEATSWQAPQGIQKWRGSPLRSSLLPGRLIVPSLHPAFIARGASAASHLVGADFKKALRYAGGEAPKEYRTEGVKDFDRIIELLDEANGQQEVAFDIESPGLDLKCFSLCWSEEGAVSIPVNGHWGSIFRKNIMSSLEELLSASSGPRLILQNGNFDTFFLERFEGIKTNLARVEDTMYLHHCLYPDIPKKLAVLSSIYTDLPYYKGDYEDSKRLADFNLLLEYNAKDALATFITWQHLKAHPQRQEIEHTYRTLTMANLPAAQHIQRRGFRIDHKGWAALRAKAEAEMAPVQRELDTLAVEWLREKGSSTSDPTLTASLLGVSEEISAEKARLKAERANAPRGHKKDFDSSHVLECLRVQETNVKDMIASLPRTFNVSSFKQVSEYFGEVHKVKRKSYDEKALQVLSRPAARREAIPEARMILAIREQRKQLEAFLGSRLDLDGRFKCSVNIRGTKFGRLSSSKLLWRYGGNVMNLPKSFRGVFIADARAGSRLPFFVNFDQSKAEAYHVAMLSGDQALLEECQGKVDGHALVGSLISGVPYDVVRAEHELLDETTDTAKVAAVRASLRCWQELPGDLRAMAGGRWPGLSIRYAGKRRRHAWNYRETPEGYSLRSGDSLADAKAQDLILRRRYAGVVNWWDKVKWEVENKHKLINCLGRVIPFMGVVTNEVWKSACAALPQSAVADVTNGAMREVEAKHDPQVILCNNIYDSLLNQLYLDLLPPLEAEVERILPLLLWIKNLMEPVLTIKGQDFVVPTDCKIGLLTFNGSTPEPGETPESRWGKMESLKLTEEGLLLALQKLQQAQEQES